MNKNKVIHVDFDDEDESLKELDAFAYSFGKYLEAIDKLPKTPVKEKEQQVMDVYKLMKQIAKGSKIRVNYKMHKPFSFAGAVTITGRNIEFLNPKEFIKAVQLADNYEVYPRTDGLVQLNFGFSGLVSYDFSGKKKGKRNE